MSRHGEPLLGASDFRELLAELGSRLADRGIEARLFVVGGAAMALAYSRTRITRDMDAVFEPKSEIYAEAEKIASDRGLAPDWLNDAVKGLLPDRVGAVEGRGTFSAPGIHVGVASAEYLFAMKAMAARQEIDRADLRVLADELKISTTEQALGLVERFYTPSRLSVKTQFILEDLVNEIQESRPQPDHTESGSDQDKPQHKQPRVRKGLPKGGQISAQRHDEPDVHP